MDTYTIQFRRQNVHMYEWKRDKLLDEKRISIIHSLVHLKQDRMTCKLISLPGHIWRSNDRRLRV